MPLRCSLSLITTSPSSLPNGPHSLADIFDLNETFNPVNLLALYSYSLFTIFFKRVVMTCLPVQSAFGFKIAGNIVSILPILSISINSLSPI